MDEIKMREILFGCFDDSRHSCRQCIHKWLESEVETC